MGGIEACPVCEGNTGGVCRSGYGIPGHDSAAFRCTACGNFEISRQALATFFHMGQSEMTPVLRAALSHKIRSNTEPTKIFFISTEWMRSFLRDGKLPNSSEQAANLIRTIGLHSSSSGGPFVVKEPELIAACGTLNGDRLKALLEGVANAGFIRLPVATTEEEDNDLGMIMAWVLSLTFSGDEAFEALKAGKDWSIRGGGSSMSNAQHTTFNIQGNIGALVEHASNSTVIGTVGAIDIGKLEAFVKQAPDMVKLLPEEIRAGAQMELGRLTGELNGERRPEMLRGLLHGFGKLVSGVRDNMIAGALTALITQEFGLTFLG